MSSIQWIADIHIHDCKEQHVSGVDVISWGIITVDIHFGEDEFGSSLEQYGMNLMDFKFKNRTASLRWNHVFSPALLSNVSIYYSRFGFGIDCDYNHAVFDYGASVRETGLKAGLVWLVNERNKLEAGVQFPYIRVNSGDCVPKEDNLTIREVHNAPNFAVQPNLFIENSMSMPWGNLRLGLRLSEYTSMGPTDQQYFDSVTHELTAVKYFGYGKPIQSYWGLEPRASVSVPVGEASSVKLSYTRERQYLQQALVSTSGSPLDVWIPASPNVKPQVSDQMALGFNRNMFHEAVEASVELFCKNNRNTYDFVEETGVLIDRKDREAFLRFGRSYSYGVEMMIGYSLGKLDGWLAYTWSKATYIIPEINGGQPYASPLNHDHNVDFLLTYDMSDRLTASAAWVYCSGAPTTFPIGRYAIGGSYAPIFASRNSSRLPDYHRLDLSLKLKTRRRMENLKWSGEWDFSLYNAYSRHNVWSVAFSYSQFEDKPQAVKLYLFPILPSVSYNLQF